MNHSTKKSIAAWTLGTSLLGMAYLGKEITTHQITINALDAAEKREFGEVIDLEKRIWEQEQVLSEKVPAMWLIDDTAPIEKYQSAKQQIQQYEARIKNVMTPEREQERKRINKAYGKELGTGIPAALGFGALLTVAMISGTAYATLRKKEEPENTIPR